MTGHPIPPGPLAALRVVAEGYVSVADDGTLLVRERRPTQQGTDALRWLVENGYVQVSVTDVVRTNTVTPLPAGRAVLAAAAGMHPPVLVMLDPVADPEPTAEDPPAPDDLPDW